MDRLSAVSSLIALSVPPTPRVRGSAFPAEDVEAIDSLACLAGATRHRVAHWAVSEYQDVDGRKAAMRRHPSNGRAHLRSA